MKRPERQPKIYARLHTVSGYWQYWYVRGAFWDVEVYRQHESEPRAIGPLVCRMVYLKQEGSPAALSPLVDRATAIYARGQK